MTTTPFNPYILTKGHTDHPYASMILNAFTSLPDLPEWILTLQGMSGRKYRKMINSIVHQMPDARYLEIGSWRGSTSCAATYNNEVNALCIDNWEWNGDHNEVKPEFESNIEKVKSNITNINYIQSDFRSVNYYDIGKYNVYLFDGPHEKMDQYLGVLISQPALDDEYILIVDDWNWQRVRNGTFNALNSLKCEIVFTHEVFTSLDDYDLPEDPNRPWWVGFPEPHIHEKSDWHNGYLFSVIKKMY